MKNNIICFIIVLGLLVGLFPMAAFASEGVTEISTKEQLNAIRNNLSGSYKLVADIIFTDADFEEGGAFYNDGMGFNPIGSYLRIMTGNNMMVDAAAFTGTLDGNGHVIKGLRINVREQDNYSYVGLFALNKGTIKNLGLEQSSITARFAQEEGAAFQTVDVGAFTAYNMGTVSHCYNTASVTATINGDVKAQVGAIAGSSGGAVEYCYNTGCISGSSNSTYWVVCGGIVGYARSVATEMSCYNVGTVSSVTKEQKNSYQGGIVGYNYSTITKSYYYGAETAVGILNGGTVQATELTKENMKVKDTYSDFDFVDDWMMGTANPPLLRVFPCVHEEADEMVIDTAASCYQEGKGHYLCVRCGEVTRDNVVIPIQHAYQKDFDSEYHFEKCGLCDDVINLQVHQFENACDTSCDCGFVRVITHDYQAAKDETGHFEKCTVCGDTINFATHAFDSDYDPFCNTCQFERADALPAPTLDNILQMLAKDPTVLQHEQAYSLLWTMMVSPSASFDFASEDIKFISYGMIYSNNEEKLSQYARDDAPSKLLVEYSNVVRYVYDEAAQGQYLTRIYKTYLHQINNVPPGKPRFGMSFIRFIYNEVIYEVYSPIVEGTITE